MAPSPPETGAPPNDSTPSGSRSSGVVARGFRLLVIALLLVAVVWIRELILVGFLAVLLATLLTYPIDFLARRLPRGVAVLITLLTLAGAVTAAILYLAPVVSEQASQLSQTAPQAIKKGERWLKRTSQTGPMSQVPHASEIADSMRESGEKKAGQLVEQTLPIAIKVVSVLSGFVLLWALAFFLAHEPRVYHAGLRALVPEQYGPVLDEAWLRIGGALRRWMAGIVVSKTIMGTLTAIGLKLIGVESWFTLGVITFFGTFIPYAGALASAIPGLAVALVAGKAQLASTCLVYLAVHLVEGYIVEPMIMKRAVALSPAVLLFWELIMGALFGILGVIAATPLLACVQVSIQYFYIERALGKPKLAPPAGG